MDLKLEPSWEERLREEISKPYFTALTEFIRGEYAKKQIFPEEKNIFAALNEVPFNDVRVIILGQDPYHGPGQAHGLSFSVPDGIDIPPSLRNIYKELGSDLNIKPPVTGNLSGWAAQGVLLLNTTLTVEAGHAGSHQGKGWEEFTDAVIRILNNDREGLVFMLWGAYAQKKGEHIDSRKHLVLTAPHPSPLSAHAGFFGCRHFSQANAYLREHGKLEIDWALTERAKSGSKK